MKVKNEKMREGKERDVKKSRKKGKERREEQEAKK
jgi:hypothetical protein